MRLLILHISFIVLTAIASKPTQQNCYVITKITKTNKTKTKLNFIKRLLPVKEGDTVCNLDQDIISTWENSIQCTNLFKNVKINVISVGQNKISLEISLKERFYWYPVPILDWANRNITEWVEKYHGNPKLLIWGLSIYRENFRWKGEMLKFMIALGSMKKFEFVYDAPWAFENLGFSFRLGASIRHFLYFPTNHKDYTNAQFIYSPDKPLENRGYIDLVFQRNIGSMHRFILVTGGRLWKISTQMIDAYQYLGNNNNTLILPVFQFSYIYIGSDNMFLPTKGTNLFVSFVSYNLKPKLTSVNLSVIKGISLSEKLTFLTTFSGKHFIKEGKPFAFASLYGFGSLQTRGYEFVTIEGQGTIILKNELRYKLLQTRIPFSFDPNGKFEIDFYAKPFVDIAYSYGNHINHKLLHHWLPSTGASLELLIYQINAIEFGFAYTTLLSSPRIFVNMQWLFPW